VVDKKRIIGKNGGPRRRKGIRGHWPPQKVIRFHPDKALSVNFGWNWIKSAPVLQIAFTCYRTGVPDGLFSYPKSQFGYILMGLGMENVGIFYGHLEYFTSIW
jgi:hypothetical protein